MKYSYRTSGTKYFAFLLLASVLLTGCNESRLEDDRQRVDEYFNLLAAVMIPGFTWPEIRASRSRCEQGIFLSSYQVYLQRALRANVLGYDIDVDRYADTASLWLTENGWTITKDGLTDRGSRELKAINHDIEVDFWIKGHSKAFNISVAGPCRTVVNWPE